MNIAMLDGRYTIVIEAPINNLDALILIERKTPTDSQVGDIITGTIASI